MGWSGRIEGSGKLSKKLKSIDRNLLNKKIMGSLAFAAVDFIKRRTAAGFDIDDSRFESYTPEYLAFKKKNAKKFFSGRVNLFLDGDMARAMQPLRVTNKSAVVGFTTTTESLKASGHNEGSTKTGLPEREFFGLGKKGDDRMFDLLGKHLRKTVGR